MKRETNKPSRNMRFDFGLSTGLHLVVWIAILIAFAPQIIPFVSQIVDQHQKAALAAAAKQKKQDEANQRLAQLPGGGQQTMPPSKEGQAAAQVESQIAQAIAGELTAADEQKMLADMHASLLKDAEKFTEAQPNADTEKLAAEMKQDAYADLAQQLKDLAAQALKDEIDAQLKGGIYDQAKNAIEHGASTQMSQAIAQKLRDTLAQERQARADKTVAGLEQAKKQFTDARTAEAQAASLANQNQLVPAADATKTSATTDNNATQAARNALAQAVQNFPQTANQADQTSKAVQGDAQQDLQAAAAALAAKTKDAAAPQLAKADASLNQSITALSQMQDQVRQAANSPDADPASQQLLSQSMGAMQKAITDQMQNQSLDPMKGQIADRLSQALASEATNLNVSAADLKALIAAEIKAQLAAEFKDHPPDAGSAMTQTKQDQRLLTPDEMEQARLAADAALKALQTARQSEANLPFIDATKTTDSLAQQQAQATDQYHQAHQALEHANDLARAVSVGDENKIFVMMDNDRAAETEAKLKVIPDLLNANQREPADQIKTQIVQGLDQRIGQMQDLENTLGQEKNALAAQTKAAGDAPKIDPQVAASVEKDMTAAVSKIAADQLPGIIASAGQVQASDAQSTDLRMQGIASLLGKVGQLQDNLAQGRPGVGLEGAGLGLGMGGMGPGMGNGMPAGRMDLYASRFAAFNAEEIEKYGAYLRNRSDPSNFYKDASEAEGTATVAQPVNPGDLPAMVYFDPEKAGPPAAPAAAAAERKVPDPSFKTVAFGAAAMMDHPVTIDGDLSDWGPLAHPIPTRFRSDGVPVTDPTQVYVRWTPDGLYIGYTTKKVGPIVPDAHAGDCIEVWLDGQNVRRKQMSDSPTSQQIFLAPFGYQGDPTPAIVEVGRGMRGLKAFAHYVDRTGSLGRVAAKMIPGGYSVEAFLSRKAIAYPNLVPGAYLAFNFSVNRGVDLTTWEQWSAPKSMVTWDKPDTWGDLLLLGTDAKARFTSFDDPTKPAQPLIPGQPLAFEIQDKDMDLNPHKRDQVPAVLRVKGEKDGLVVILEETTNDSGIFRASINTQSYEAPPKANTLNIRGGDSVELIYNDLRTEYGETDRVVTADLPVGTPVLRLAGRP